MVHDIERRSEKCAPQPGHLACSLIRIADRDVDIPMRGHTTGSLFGVELVAGRRVPASELKYGVGLIGSHRNVEDLPSEE